MAFADRITDITLTPQLIRGIGQECEDIALVSLEMAVKPLVLLVRDIERNAWIAKQRCQNPPDDLSTNESAAIFLYTVEWKPYHDSLYFLLNNTLRSEDRTQLKPWLPYLKLLITALNRLPTIVNRTVYRGVKKNLSARYLKGKTFGWWAFSSCTTSIDALEKEYFLGKKGPRTLFAIETISGRDIHGHSSVPDENEVLLLAGCHFTVISSLHPGSDLHIIQLKETTSPCTISIDNLAVLQSPWCPSLVSFPLISTHKCKNLAKLISKCETQSTIYLDRQSLTDQDIPGIVQQALREKQCRCLRLSNNKVKFNGALVLAEALGSITTLEELHLFGNKITDRGVLRLSRALSENQVTLKALGLGGNGITDEGATHLAEMLKTNETLIDLSLAWNRIGDMGLQQIGDVLIRYNRTLKRLCFDLNELVSDASITVLLDMIGGNHALTSLSLVSCGLSKTGRKRLCAAAKLRMDLQVSV